MKSKETIDIGFYILTMHFWLKVITNELVKKAKEGVVIKVMFDYIGSRNKYSNKFISTLKKNTKLRKENLLQ